MEQKAEWPVERIESENSEKKTFHPLSTLILVNIVLIVIVLLFIFRFYHALEKQIYTERTAYLEEITAQIVSSTNTISSEQWYFSDIFANHLLNEKIKEVVDLSAYIAQEQAAFSQSGLTLLVFDQDGRYYDAEGNQAKWAGSIAMISDEAPENQVEITTLPTSEKSDDEMVFMKRMPQSVSLEDGIVLTHVAVVRNMSLFSETFRVPSFNGKGESYIISNEGTGVYRGQGASELIGNIYNILKPLESVKFKYGGSYEGLREAVSAEKTCSLEFSAPDGREWYVTCSPIGRNNWSLLSLVPAEGINVKMQQFMNMVLLGAGIIAFIIIVAVTLTIFLTIYYRTGQRIMRQQARANAALREAAQAAAEAAQAAEEANRAKSVFLSHMSHDIRTPINGIMGMTDIALRNMGNQSRVTDCLGKISIASRHLLGLINDVLDISRIESGKVEIENDPFCLDDLLDGCYSVVAGQAAEKKLVLYKDFSGVTCHYLLGDELHLRQILINILGNAIKFTPEEGKVEFLAEDRTISSGESELTVIIRDNGIGMSEEFQKKIFEPFSQAAGVARSKYNGTGLGMSIVKQLVDLMGGEINLQSAIGKGSTFIVRLRLPIEEAPVQINPSDGEADNLSGLHVLLAEDNELNMEIACYILEECGMQVTPAFNGQEALDQFVQQEAGSFDIILMDVMMPVMDGVEAARAIRSSGKSDAKEILIVAMTANAYAEDGKITMAAGMDRHLAKPIERDELIRTLSELVYEKNRGKNGKENEKK